MPVTLTKAEMAKILVAERKKSRAKAAKSKFMSRTLSIYNNQKKRLAEMRAEESASGSHVILCPSSLPYTLAEFRQKVEVALALGECPYSGQKLTLKHLAADHDVPVSRGGSWELENVVLCHQSANWQKGNMTGAEFIKLMYAASKILEPVAFDAMKRRLSMGGKWLNQGGH